MRAITVPATLSSMAPVRLLKLIPVFAYGGTERQVVNLARTIDREHFDLRFGCLRRWGHFLKDIEDCDIPVSEYPIKRLYGPHTLMQQIRLARDMRRSGISIMHSYNFYANVFAIPAARMAGVPVTIASIRDQGMYVTPAQRCVQKYFCRFADCVQVNASAIRDWLIEDGYNPDKITLIRNGIDLSRFQHHVDGERIRHELGVPADAPLVVMLSRLSPTKGAEVFLEAAVEIIRRCPQVRFLIVGEEGARERNGIVQSGNEYRQKLEKQAERLGIAERVLFTGYRDDVPELLSQAAVSVLPTLRGEGMSNTVLESMAAGVPVVATRVGGTPEIVEDDETGFLVPPGDPDALARATLGLLNNADLAQRLGNEAGRRARNRYSLGHMVRETESLYSRLLEQKKCREFRRR